MLRSDTYGGGDNSGAIAANRTTILVIDDDEANVRLFSRVLRHEGFHVETAIEDNQASTSGSATLRPVGMWSLPSPSCCSRY